MTDQFTSCNKRFERWFRPPTLQCLYYASHITSQLRQIAIKKIPATSESIIVSSRSPVQLSSEEDRRYRAMRCFREDASTQYYH
jgi:hypothetical protein